MALKLHMRLNYGKGASVVRGRIPPPISFDRAKRLTSLRSVRLRLPALLREGPVDVCRPVGCGLPGVRSRPLAPTLSQHLLVNLVVGSGVGSRESYAPCRVT